MVQVYEYSRIALIIGKLLLAIPSKDKIDASNDNK